MKKIVYFLLATLFLSTSCSVIKRSYMPGYHVELASAKKKRENLSAVCEQKNLNKKEIDVANEAVTKQPSVDSEIIASSNNKLLNINIVNIHHNIFSEKKDSCSDLISLRNGMEITGKILEVNETQIKYKRCDNISGPLLIVNKNEVAFIKYSNGQAETLVKNPAESQNLKDDYVIVKKVNPFAVASFILGFFSFLFFPYFLAILLGIIAIKQIKDAPNKYSGKFLAWFWIIATPIALIILIGSIFYSLLAII